MTKLERVADHYNKWKAGQLSTSEYNRKLRAKGYLKPNKNTGI